MDQEGLVRDGCLVIKMFCVGAKSRDQFSGVYKTWARSGFVYTPNSLAMDSYRVVYFSSIYALSLSIFFFTPNSDQNLIFLMIALR